MNYTHGKVNLPLGADLKPTKQLQDGQQLSTESGGRAELLLTPGSYLRLDSDSEVRMVSTKLTAPVVELLRGTESFEINELAKTSTAITVIWHEQRIAVNHAGLYRFEPNADQMRVYVLQGKLRLPGSKDDLKTGHYQDVSASGVLSASRKFNPNDLDEFDRFNRRRAQSLTASAERAAYAIRTGYYDLRGAGFLNAAYLSPAMVSGLGFWMYDPWSLCYSWIPNRYSVYSPWGFAYYAPRAYRAPTQVANSGGGGTGRLPANAGGASTLRPPRPDASARVAPNGPRTGAGLVGRGDLPPRFVPPSSMPAATRAYSGSNSGFSASGGGSGRSAGASSGSGGGSVSVSSSSSSSGSSSGGGAAGGERGGGGGARR